MVLTHRLSRWYSQLQNDCKNVYSSDYAKAKGAIAEDLRNGELSYPNVVALNVPKGQYVVRALAFRSPHNIRQALRVIQSDQVRNICLTEMKKSAVSVQDWLALWGRNEKMDMKNEK